MTTELKPPESTTFYYTCQVIYNGKGEEVIRHDLCDGHPTMDLAMTCYEARKTHNPEIHNAAVRLSRELGCTMKIYIFRCADEALEEQPL